MTFHPFPFYGIKDILGMLEHWNDGIVAGFLILNEYLKVRWAR
jgi:hypothetical protein